LWARARLEIMSVAIHRLLEGALVGLPVLAPAAGVAQAPTTSGHGVLMPQRYEWRSVIASYRSKGRGFPCALRALF
jgi:hypothetical protein